MDTEPPPGFVAFVADHLGSLRQDTARVADDEREADALCTDVLTDVAARWHWLELQRQRLRRRAAGDLYLHQALARRTQQARSDDRWVVEVQVWSPDEVFGPVPRWSSAALRLTPHVTAPARAEAVPVLEAGIAWWHAYEAHRRRKIIALVVLAAVFALLLGRAHSEINALGPPTIAETAAAISTA